MEFELREFPDGSGGILIFTELDLLVAQLGEFQPWEKVAVLDLFIQVSGAKIPIMVNPVVDPGQERWTAASLAAWRDER